MPDPLFKILRRKSPKVELVQPDQTAYETKHPQYAYEISPLAHDDCEVGIEIEVENVAGNPNYYTVWTPKPDGSLRNNGLEFISAPIKGKRIHYALNQFFDYLDKKAHFSPRTSIHVHINVLNLTPPQVGGMVMVSAVVERLMYKFVGGDRDKNNFCVPLGEAYAPNVIKMFVDEPFMGLNTNENNRYLGLNTDAVRKFGTLEYRHLGGTRDKLRIVNWINLLLSLKKFAETHSLENIKEKIDRLNTDSGYSVFVDEIFGAHGGVLDQRTLMKDMAPMVSVVKKLILKNDFVQKLMMETVPEKSHVFSVLMGKDTSGIMEYIYPNPIRPRLAGARRPARREAQVARQDVDPYQEILRQERARIEVERIVGRNQRERDAIPPIPIVPAQPAPEELNPWNGLINFGVQAGVAVPPPPGYLPADDEDNW
jgi:hypothetical protein